MNSKFKAAADTVLDYTVNRFGGAPGVVAMATERSGNVYEGAVGKRELGKDQPMTTDSVFAIFSTTKAVTGVTVMQLVEEGKISLSDPAKKYVPAIGELRVLEGFDAAGQPKTRPPKRDITVNDLILHTSGLCYECFSADDLKYREATGVPSVLTCTDASIKSVLLHDPGERWTYGVNIDWLGKIVEQQRGKRLGEVMKERIFGPLGIQDMAFTMTDSMKARRVTIHQRESGRQADAAARAGVAATPGTRSRRPRAVLDGGRVHEVHPHVPERRCRAQRSRAQGRDCGADV